MAHPAGGRGNLRPTARTFNAAWAALAVGPVNFISTTGEPMVASRGTTRTGLNAIVFKSRNSGTRHGNCCITCWGFTYNCSGARTGHCSTVF